MNKQELINKINQEITELKSTEASCFKLGSKTEELKFTNRIMGLQLALNWSGQLDEPQKVKVPAFVAEYIKWCKQHNWHLNAMAMPSNAKFFESHSKPSGVHDWINENYDTFLVAISTDYYEVEEVAEWVVRVKEMYFLNWGEDGTCPTFVIDDYPGANLQAHPFIKSEAQSLASDLRGTIEKVTVPESE